MGKIQVVKLVAQGGNPPYRYLMSPRLKNLYDYNYVNTYTSGNVVQFDNANKLYYWGINYNNEVSFFPSSYNDVQNIEIQCKFFPISIPGNIEEIFSLCSIFTPDWETNGCLGFWDNTNNQYWLEYPITIGNWYWLKLYYDKATYTQTWSISTDGINFTTIGTHNENRNYEIENNWNSNGQDSWLLFGNLNTAGNIVTQRTFTTGCIDFNETWIKVNGNFAGRGYILSY